MRKIIVLLFIISINSQAQVGINTTNPDAQLDIRSSNQATPSNTDGILIPKIDAFPAINPTAAQQGMLVYLTTPSGTDVSGFYYWDNNTLDWKPIAGASLGTLDQAYDFGGAGNGRTITADAGAVTINGTDGFISTGILDSGSIISNATGDRMFWYPRKGAFRVGRTDSTQWDDVNIGQLSSAFGYNTISSGSTSFAFGESTTASGNHSTAFGSLTSASGNRSTAFGSGTIASGLLSTAFGAGTIASGTRSIATGLTTIASNQNTIAFGEFTNASGYNSSAFGVLTTASGSYSTAFGVSNEAPSYGEIVFGIGATAYTPSSGGSTLFRTTNANDRLFVIGNAIDNNSNLQVDASERSDAMIVLKNGLTRLPSTTNTMIDTADGKAVVTKEYLQSNNWSLTGNTGTNPATNFVGTTDNVDLVFRRANSISGRIGNSNTFFGRLSGSMATGGNNTYIGTEAGRDNVTGQENVFIGRRAGTFGATGSYNILIGNGAGIFNEANQNCFIGSFSGNGTTTGSNNTFMGDSSGSGNGTGNQNAFFGALAGNTNTTGVGNTLLGTNSDVALNNLTNASAIGFNARVDASNSLVLGSINGVNSATSSVNVGIGTSTPQDRLHVVGNIRMVDGNQATGRVLTSNANGTATWQNASANAWGLIGNTGTNSTINFIGTADDVDVVFRRNSIFFGRLANTNISLGREALSSNSIGSSNTAIGDNALKDNTTGFGNTSVGSFALDDATIANFNTAIGERALAFNVLGENNTALGSFTMRTNINGSNNTTLGSLSNVSVDGLSNATAVGANASVGANNSLVLGSVNGVNGATSSVNVGIGTITPDNKLHVSDNSTSTTIGQLYLEQQGTGDALLHIGNTGARHFNLGLDTSEDKFKIGTSATTATAVTTGTLMTLQPTGEVGIGTTTPAEKLHVSGPAGLTAVRIGNTSGVGATSNVALDFFRNTAINTDWRIYNIGANLTVGNSGDDLATVNDLYQFQGNRFMPMNDGTQNLGQAANRWNTVFATNGTINTSDRREKKEIQPLHYGLNQLMQLKPVSFKWNNSQIDNGSKHLGFIAQDLQEVLPEVVVDSEWVEENGNKVWKKALLLGVNYAEVIPVLVQSIQEQQAIIQAQKKEIENQKATLEIVLQRLAVLEKK